MMPCIVCDSSPASAKQNDSQGNKSMNVAEVALEKKGLTSLCFTVVGWIDERDMSDSIFPIVILAFLCKWLQWVRYSYNKLPDDSSIASLITLNREILYKCNCIQEWTRWLVPENYYLQH